jgi:phytol kinase
MELIHKFADDMAGLAMISAAIVALIVLVDVASRLWSLPHESTRKTAHVGSGLVLLSVPWLVHHPETLMALALIFSGALTLARRFGLLNSLHGVPRRSDGVMLFPLAVALVYGLSGRQPIQYCIPLLILAVSDTAAAMVGQRFGKLRYNVGNARRSLEGNVAFVVTAMGLTWALLIASGEGGILDSGLIAAAVALAAGGLEAVSGRGWDNLTVPVGSWAVLHGLLFGAPLAAACAPSVVAVILLFGVTAGMRLQIHVRRAAERA